MSSTRHRWSWRSCFAAVKHNQKSKKQEHQISNQDKWLPNDLTRNSPYRAKFDENSNLLNHFNELSDKSINDQQKGQISSLTSISESLVTKSNDEFLSMTEDFLQSSITQIQSIVANQKSLSGPRASYLDAIVEESNEENIDEFNETSSPVKPVSDREIIGDCHELHSRLIDLSKMNHVILQFNDNDSLYGEFTRQIRKLKLKSDDIERTATEIPRDAELLEARYSTLLATIENLSLLLKMTRICLSRTLITRLLTSIEQRMEQLNKILQLRSLSSASIRQFRQDSNDDDLLSFRSAFSSYEHLLNT